MDQSETKYIKPAKYLEKIGEPELVRWLQESYPLQIVKLVSVPKGEIGDNYVAVTANEDKYFLKIHLRSKLHIDNPQGLQNTLGLTSRFARDNFLEASELIPVRQFFLNILLV